MIMGRIEGLGRGATQGGTVMYMCGWDGDSGGRDG